MNNEVNDDIKRDLKECGSLVISDSQLSIKVKSRYNFLANLYDYCADYNITNDNKFNIFIMVCMSEFKRRFAYLRRYLKKSVKN